ncbi:MAG TPA: hypothetical protein VHI52_14630, partial [Verrucomicrobiae bacterium]|nr:hypothetical protein [Verrucomicrobiae bacterium]
FVTNSANPVVVARSYVTPPTLAQNSTFTAFAVGGVQIQSAPVSRAIQVTCSKGNLFLVAMVAKQTINLNGNNVTTDSYDSSDPTKSTNGQYDSSKYTGDKGDVATNLGIADSLGVGNANINGHAHTGPGSASDALQIGPNGHVGPHSGGSGVTSGWWMQDANFTFPDTTMPNTGGYFTPTGGVLVTSAQVGTNIGFQVTYPLAPVPTGLQTNTAAVSGAPLSPAVGTYVPGTLSSSTKHGTTTYSYTAINYYYWPSNQTMTVYTTNSYDHILWGTSDLNHTNYYTASSLSGTTIVVGTNAVLALPNGLGMSGNDAFTISPGANVVVYSGGTSCAIGGNGVINQPGYPANFVLYCAPSVTSFSLSGNGGFNGILVAPSVNMSMNGGGNNTIDFCGCLMVNSVTMNGHFNFHYDEALGKNGGSGRYLITAWNEIK